MLDTVECGDWGRDKGRERATNFCGHNTDKRGAGHQSGGR